jgi:hypothetical protein
MVRGDLDGQWKLHPMVVHAAKFLCDHQFAVRPPRVAAEALLWLCRFGGRAGGQAARSAVAGRIRDEMPGESAAICTEKADRCPASYET